MLNDKNTNIPEDEYEVEDILDSRIVPVYDYKKKKYKKIKEYEIKWVGYDQTTWEPESNLEHCQEILSDFKKRVEKKKRNNKRAKKVGYPKEQISTISKIGCLTSFQSDPNSSQSCSKYSSGEYCPKINFQKKNSKKFPKVNKNKSIQKENSLNELNSFQEASNFIMPLSEETKMANNFFYSDSNEIKKKSYKRNLSSKKTPYIAYKDIKNLSSFKNFGPSFEEVLFFDARPNKITLFKKEQCCFDDSSDENNIKKKGKFNYEVINNYKMNNSNREIESLEIVNVIRPSSNERKNYSVDARFNIKENSTREINYLNKVDDEKLKEFFGDIFRLNFEGKSLKYK